MMWMHQTESRAPERAPPRARIDDPVPTSS